MIAINLKDFIARLCLFVFQFWLMGYWLKEMNFLHLSQPYEIKDIKAGVPRVVEGTLTLFKSQNTNEKGLIYENIETQDIFISTQHLEKEGNETNGNYSKMDQFLSMK